MVRKSQRKNAYKKPDTDQTRSNSTPQDTALTENKTSSGDQMPGTHSYDRIISGLTLLVLFFTFLAAVFAGVEADRLARYTSRSLRDAREAASSAHRDNVAALKAANAALQQARDNFRADERPYIWLADAHVTKRNDLPTLEMINEPRNVGQINWDVRFTNYGKSPALKINIRFYYSLGGRPFVPSFGADYSESTPWPEGGGNAIPPTKTDFFTVVTAPVTPEYFYSLQHMEEGIKIAVEIRYSDAAGGAYETDLCMAQLTSGAVLWCDDFKGNQIK